MNQLNWQDFVDYVTQKSTLHLAVIGSRYYTDLAFVESYVHCLHTQLGARLALVTGAGKGVDTLARQIAEQHSISITVVTANWRQCLRTAGCLRSKKLVQASDAVLAFAMPTSKGTRYTYGLANDRGLPVHMVRLPTCARVVEGG